MIPDPRTILLYNVRAEIARDNPKNYKRIMKKINPEPITHPELLAPAGSPEALRAAIAAGADAVYFGTSVFNARMNAKNFEGDNLADAIKLCRATGV